MAEATNCVVCSALCPSEDISCKRITDQLAHNRLTIEQFLLSKDVIPAGASAFGNSRICPRCHSFVFSCDAHYSAIEENLRTLRDIRSHVVDSVLRETSRRSGDIFFDDDLKKDGSDLTDLGALALDDFSVDLGYSDDSWGASADFLGGSPSVTSSVGSFDFRIETSLSNESPGLLSSMVATPDLAGSEVSEVKGVIIGTPLSCEKCHFTCVAPEALEEHVQKCSSGESHACDVCDARFMSQKRLKTHRSKIHGAPRTCFPCPRCKTKKLTSQENLDKHLLVCNIDAPRMCRECGETIDGAKWAAHVQRHTRARGNRSTLPCPHCENVVFRHPISLKRHLYKEHGIGPAPLRRSEQGHTCPHCEKHYRCAKHFTAHMFEKHGVVLPGLAEYKCSICDKVFHVKQRYEVHMDGHSEVPKYSCQDCGYKTRFSSSMSAHKRRCTKTDPV